MRVHFTSLGWDDYASWTDDPDVRARLNRLIEEVRRDPFKGTGKPEPLKRPLDGWWSRRITREHRLVYRVEGKGDEQRVVVSSCRYHYAAR